MAKNLEPITFDRPLLGRELAAFEKLLKKPSLTERGDIRPFFARRRQLAAYLGSYALKIGRATELAFEFPLFGDFAADLILGNHAAGEYCLVEFEDGSPDSVFKKQPKRGSPEWSARFEHGFSQIVDWFHRLSDVKGTEAFGNVFGHGHVRFGALLVIGRDAGLDDAKRNRLRWRTEKVLIDSHPVSCVTFDELATTLRTRFAYYTDSAGAE